MKSKIIVFIVCAAAVTFSFSFARSPKSSEPKQVVEASAPAGGFISEDKF